MKVMRLSEKWKRVLRERARSATKRSLTIQF
jgi:hypothetical protein